MKKYVFTLHLDTKEEQVPIVAKNIQSAVAKLCQGDYYNEDQIVNISIFKK